MAQSFAFCQAQMEFHRERAESAQLENVRDISAKAVVAWAREAELARVVEARRASAATANSLPPAGSASEHAEDAEEAASSED